MFTKNVGTTDRAIRIVVGLALLLGYALNGSSTYGWLYLIGIIPLATGIVGSCGLYAVFGLSTCKMK